MIGYTPDLLVRGRALARARMRARVVIRRQVGEYRDPETGRVTPETVVVYPPPGVTGIAELRIGDTVARTGDSAGQRFSEAGPLVVLPCDGDEAAAAANVGFDDVGEVLEDPDNPGNVGATFRVTGPHVKSLATARRLPVTILSTS